MVVGAVDVDGVDGVRVAADEDEASPVRREARALGQDDPGRELVDTPGSRIRERQH